MLKSKKLSEGIFLAFKQLCCKFSHNSERKAFLLLLS